MISSHQNITQLLKLYEELHVEETIDWEKYNHYSIVHHSTSIEGSTLTKEETQLLLDDDIAAKGKPLEHHHMQKDHYKALLFVLDTAKKRKPITPQLLKDIAGYVMQNTGSIHNTMVGSFDSSKGDFRLLNVRAGETRFIDYTKVVSKINQFCKELNDKLKSIESKEDALITSFDAHLNLVSIHPFADGNGRVSRLIMNYVQQYFDLPLSNVFKEDKADYYTALQDTREKEDINIFRYFMLEQYKKMLTEEIKKVKESKKTHVVKKNNNNDIGLSLMF
jgi:Fic family protein